MIDKELEEYCINEFNKISESINQNCLIVDKYISQISHTLDKLIDRVKRIEDHLNE